MTKIGQVIDKYNSTYIDIEVWPGNPDLLAEEISDEWIRLTFVNNEKTVETIAKI